MNNPEPLPLPERRYETTDANALYLTWFALGLAIVLALVLLLIRMTFRQFESVAKRTDELPSAVASDQTPPAPRLQTNPRDDLSKLRQHEDTVLTNYAWIDKPKDIVRVPIDRAIRLLAQRGLPEPDGPVTEKSKP